ncbi:sensor histidine kinase [Fodinicola feengrottensis]|uniref:sensor histidine kinase n=1 Tax=Fodinicola feengrottensis TaxID=435914 RepID=UPI0024436CAC|nr:sensor histidine kinase [Fodinicola feengrottensis]
MSFAKPVYKNLQLDPHGTHVPTSWGGFDVLVLILCLGWLAGQAPRHRRAYLEEALRHAADGERDQVRLAALAVAAERARISRELHDVVAHSLSVMVVQAQGGGPRRWTAKARTRGWRWMRSWTPGGSRWPRCAGSLMSCRTRRIARSTGGRSLAPASFPRSSTGSGTPACRSTSASTGVVRALPPTIDVSAYRIAQEALTNVVKHAGPDPCAAVRLRYEDSQILLEVTDHGTGPTEPIEPGHGVRGMRERAALLGGDLEVGPKPDGGYRVWVRLPTTVVP